MPSTILGEHATTLPAGTTLQRPTGVQGMIRYNTTLEQLEMFDGADWTIVKSSFTATGGTIYANQGGYNYHKFTSSGNFVVSKGTKQVEYLICAGGAAGGHRHAGGGGAGGLTDGFVTVSPQTYSIVIGAGGAKRTVPDQQDIIGPSGANSTGFGITAIGGGGGGCNGSAGVSGGSGSATMLFTV